MIQGTTANGLAHFLTVPEEVALERTMVRLETILEGRGTEYSLSRTGSIVMDSEIPSDVILLVEELRLLRAIQAGLGRVSNG